MQSPLNTIGRLGHAPTWFQPSTDKSSWPISACIQPALAGILCYTGLVTQQYSSKRKSGDQGPTLVPGFRFVVFLKRISGYDPTRSV